MRLDIDCVVILAYSESGSKAVHLDLTLRERPNVRKGGAPEILRFTGKSNHVERRLKIARSVINVVSEQERITPRDCVTCNPLAKLWLGKFLYWYTRSVERLSQRFCGNGPKATEEQQGSRCGRKDLRQHLSLY